MENSQLDPNQPINILTVVELEALLTKVIQKVVMTGTVQPQIHTSTT